MTDEERLSALSTAALYQQQLDALTRRRDEYKAAIATLDTQIQAKTKSLDDIWKQLRIQVGSGS